METVTIRVRSIAWFVTGGLIAVAVTLMFVNAWRADAAPGDEDTTLVPITPCRLADTRPAPNRVGTAGPIGTAGTQTFQATGTNGNCTIPNDAVALQLNVTALGASNLTFLTFWPSDEARPLAANLNPAPGQFPTPNAVTVALSPTGEFNVYNDLGAVNIVIDINGYYTKRSLQELAGEPDLLYAIVNTAGDLVRHRGGVDAGTGNLGTGLYEVEFDRDITSCVAIGNPADSSSFFVTANEVTTVARGGDADSVFVEVHASNGTLTDSAFTIVVICP